MTKRVNIFVSWHPILAIREWWAHQVLRYACGIYDRALRAQRMQRATRRQFIRKYGVLAMSVGREKVMLDYDRLNSADRSIIDGMIARQRAQDAPQRGQQEPPTAAPDAPSQPSAPTQKPIPLRKPPTTSRA